MEVKDEIKSIKEMMEKLKRLIETMGKTRKGIKEDQKRRMNEVREGMKV